MCRWGGYQTLGVRQCSTQSNYSDALRSDLSKWIVVKNLINNFTGGEKKEVADLSCFYLSISVLLSSLMCCFCSWDEQDLKGRDWFGNWAFTSIHESFFKKKNKEKNLSVTCKLFSNSISQQMVSVSHSVCFCSYQASVVFLKHFLVKYAKFPHRQTVPSQLQGFDK